MTSHSIIARASLTLLLIGVLALQGCLTKMLWAEDLSGPPLMHTEALCRVHSIRGDFLASAASARSGVEIEFSVQREKDTPTEVEPFTPEAPGRLRLRPPVAEENWFRLPGASLFVPKMWEFGVYRGSYFATRDSSVPLSFVGDLRPDQIGELRPDSKAPSAWRRMRRLPQADNLHELLAAGLKTFGARDWVNLITGEVGFTEHDAVPLSWLDAEGRVLSSKELQERLITSRLDPATAEDLAKYTLLGRLDGAWGDPLYVRVPLPILVQGESMRLKRFGERVLWERSQVWTGELGGRAAAPDPEKPDSGKTDDVAASEARTRPANSIPLMTSHFVYSYAEENTSKSVLVTLAKYILTPPAILLDFVGQTSVFYADIIRWMAHGRNQTWSGPITDEKKK